MLDEPALMTATHALIVYPADPLLSSRLRWELNSEWARTRRRCGWRRIQRRRRRIPSTSKRLIEVDHREQLVTDGLGERILCRKQQLLSLKHFEVARASCFISLERQLGRLLQSPNLALERSAAAPQCLLCCERVGSFSKCNEDQLFVVRDRFVPIRLTFAIRAFQPSACIDRSGRAQRETPEGKSGPAGSDHGFCAHERRQPYFRKEIRDCNANFGIGS